MWIPMKTPDGNWGVESLSHYRVLDVDESPYRDKFGSPGLIKTKKNSHILPTLVYSLLSTLVAAETGQDYGDKSEHLMFTKPQGRWQVPGLNWKRVLK
jgi:hypothetical protein